MTILCMSVPDKVDVADANCENNKLSHMIQLL